MSRSEDPLIGRTIRGSIEIVKRIGEGGMGFVYEAYQSQLERKLAVKVMTPEHARNPVAADYFLREALSAARLRHPNIIQIIDFGKEGDDLLFLAMEFIPGEPLTELIELFYPLEKERIINIFTQTLSGLEEAHAHHVIHRDLKPDNLMIETTRSGDDHVKILDFGIAHLRDNNSQGGVLTQQGAILGTPHYMSPEQARGQRVDARSDLFSMGVILYEVLTGQRPFIGKNMPEILMKVMTHVPVPPSALRTDVEIDPGLEAVCMRAIRKEEELRYQSAAEFRLALEAVRREAQNKAAPAGAKFIFKRRGERSRSGVKPLPNEPSEPRLATVQSHSTPEDEPAEQATVITSPPELPADSAQIMHHELPPSSTGIGAEVSNSHVVNISALFDSIDDFDKPQTQPPAVAARAPVIPSEPAAPKSSSVFGVDLGEMREDLLGERRHVSVMVLHQRMYSVLDAEEVFEFTEEFESILQGMCQKWGGQVQSHQGGYYTVFFGFVRPTEDDHLRAAQMALAMRSMCARFVDRSINIAIALSMGEVFCPGKAIARAAGAPLTGATEAAQRAADDELIVVGELLQSRLEERFILSKSMGDGARSLIAARDMPAQEDSFAESSLSLQSLLGREREVAVVLSALGRLSRQQGGLLCVTGEAGIGKSAILGQAQRFALQRDVLTIRARAVYKGAHGLRDVLKQWTREVLTKLSIPDEDLLLGLTNLGLDAEYARLLDGVLHDKLDELITFKGGVADLQSTANSERAIEVAMRRLLMTLSTQRKVLLVLDEVTDFDDRLESMCARLMAHLSGQPLLLMMGLRTNAGDPPPVLPSDATLLNVENLDEAAAKALFLSDLSRELPDAFISKLTRLSAGIPLQIKQLAQLVALHPEASVDQIEEMLAEDHGINALMRLRLFALPSEAQNILAMLAVLGDATEAYMLLDLASSSWQPEESMQRLYDQGFLLVEEHVQGARLFFTPPAMRMVVYKNLSRKNRAKIHERAVKYLSDRLERRGQIDVDERLALAYHCEKLRRLDLAQAHLRWLYNKAFRSFQYQDAVDLLERLQKLGRVAHPDDVQAQARYELDRARIEFAQGQLKSSIARVLKLDRSGVLEEPLDVEVRLELARQWLENEDPVMLESMLAKLVKRLKRASLQDASQHWMLARAQGLYATTLEKQNKHTLAMQALLDVIDFIESRDLAAHDNPLGPSLIWEPLNQLGRVRLKTQDIQGAFKMFELALNSVQHFEDQLGEIVVRGNMATLYSMQERFEEGIRQVQAALGLARKSGQVRDVAKLLYNQGLIRMRQRRHEPAKQAFIESEAICRELDWREGIAMNVSQLRGLEKIGSSTRRS